MHIPRKIFSLLLVGVLAVTTGLTLWEVGQKQVINQNASTTNNSPYPYSTFITSFSWDPVSKLTILPSNGDNWPATWGDNGLLYTSYGDGTGFSGSRNLSLGFATVSGTPPSGMHGTNFKTSIDTPTGWSKAGIKSSGLIMVNSTLYVFVRNDKAGGKDYRHSRVAKSSNHGATWTWASWNFSNTFGVPDFVQYGPNYQGGDPTYVYVVSQDNNDAYTRSPNIVLARVPKDQVDILSSYEFFSGTNDTPQWSKNIDDRKPIFTDLNGTQRVSISFNSALQRYFLVTSHDDGSHRQHTNALGVFDAPNPWGPWTTDYYSNSWSLGDSYEQKFPPMYMSSNGKTMWILFSGDSPTPYKFTLRKVTLTVQQPTPTPTNTPTPLPTATPTPTPTPKPTQTANARKITPKATVYIARVIPTNTPIPTQIPTPTLEPTPTNIPTDTPIPTDIPTPTELPTDTPTPSLPPLPTAAPTPITFPTQSPTIIATNQNSTLQPSPTPTQIVAGATSKTVGLLLILIFMGGIIPFVIPQTRKRLLLFLVKLSFYGTPILHKIEQKDTTSLNAINKVYDVKLTKAKKGDSPSWVMLTDENGTIEGYFDGEIIQEGFAQVKGILHTDSKTPYVTISSIIPIENKSNYQSHSKE